MSAATATIDPAVTTASPSVEVDRMDVGITDPLDPVLDRVDIGVVRRLQDLLDRRVGVAVDDDGIEVRTGIRTRRHRWKDIQSIETSSRLRGLVAAGLGMIPLVRLRKLPLVGAGVAAATQGLAHVLTDGPLSGLDDRLGNRVVRIVGRRKTQTLAGATGILATFSPELTEHLVREARRRGIPVDRDE